MLAVAYAQFEDHYTSGLAEPRDRLLKHLIQQDILDELPPDGNPFGPDPAQFASIGRDGETYYAPTAPTRADETMPPARPTAAGK